MKRNAFTLLEFLVVLAIIGLLVAMILPAIQYAREASRRAMCASNLRQMMIAVHTYESGHKVFPPGANAYGMSLHVSLLPYIEQANLHNLLGQDELTPADPDAVWANPPALPNPVVFNCPSDYGFANLQRRKGTNYAGNYGTGMQDYGYNGAFHHLISASTKWPEGPISTGMVTDGLSSTAFIAEVLVSDGSTRPRRIVFRTQNNVSNQGELTQFAKECRGGPYVMQGSQPIGGTITRGLPWLRGEAGFTLYNHVLGPNQPSCTNKSFVQHGAYSASSNHPAGVQVAFGDGRVSFIADSIDDKVWHAAGSRNGNDVSFSVP